MLRKQPLSRARCLVLLVTLGLFWPAITSHGQEQLLETFREEFIEITPGANDFPEQFQLREQGSQTLGDDSPRELATTTRFWIAKYEVTQNLWEQVMGDNPSRWKGPRNSVELLSYDEAVEFCHRVTEMLQEAQLIGADQLIRLPTEAEWEYCCRAGTDGLYSFGDELDQLDDHAWHTGNAAGNDPPVGALEPNPWGLYDIHGYLWEWCVSEIENPDEPVHLQVEDWAELGNGSKAVLRGGSWKDPAERLQSGYRQIVDRELKDDAVGLRCVLIDVASAAETADDFQPLVQTWIVPQDSQLELVWCDGDFTEGPAAGPDDRIYFSDIGDRIMVFDPASGETTEFLAPSGRSNGMQFDSRGRLIACHGANTGGLRQISRGSLSGERETLANEFDGQRFNSPNDLVLDANDNVYFTDPRYVGDEPRELDFEGIFRVTPNGDVQIAYRDLTKPNGILLSPDGETAYVAEHHPTGDKHLVRFDVQDDGQFANPTVMFDFGEGRGIDGMAMDDAGNIYATAGSDEKSGVYVFDPEGRHLALIRLPGNPTNCCFGQGDANNILYITAQGPASDSDIPLTTTHLPQGQVIDDDDGESADADSDRRFGLYRIKLLARGLRTASSSD